MIYRGGVDMKYEQPFMEITIFDADEICNTTLVSGDPSVDSGNMGWTEDMGSGGGYGEPF